MFCLKYNSIFKHVVACFYFFRKKKHWFQNWFQKSMSDFLNQWWWNIMNSESCGSSLLQIESSKYEFLSTEKLTLMINRICRARISCLWQALPGLVCCGLQIEARGAHTRLYMRWSGRQKESKWWRIVVFIWSAAAAAAAAAQLATAAMFAAAQLLELKSNLAFLLASGAAAHFRRLLRLSKINVVKFSG